MQRSGIVRRLLLGSGILLLACGRQGEPARMTPAAMEAAPPGAPATTGAPVAALPQKLIRTGALQLEVTDFDVAAAALGQLARNLGGYVADTQVSRNPGGHRSGQVVLRIPAERFEAAGTSIRSLGKLLSERSTVEDVTKAYTDLETRLKVKRDELARIRELLKSKAGTLKDILEAEREISRITEEIELAEGERQYYDHQIRLSTISVDLQEPVPASLAGRSALGDVFRNAATTLAESLAVLIGVILVLLPWSVMGFGVYRWIRWLLRRRKARLEGLKAEAEEPRKPV